MKSSLPESAEVPPGVVTVTSTVPVPAGEWTVIWVAELTETLVPAFPPKATVAPLTKPVPVIVTVVLPPVGPARGLRPVTVGTAK